MTIEARIARGIGRYHGTIAQFAWISASMMLVLFLAFGAWLVATVNSAGYAGSAIQIDFAAFWAAAKLAVAGVPMAAFDPDALRAAQDLPPGASRGDLLWLYPPSWHAAILPLGLLPFSAAYLLFSAITLAAFAAAARPLAAPLPGGLALVLAGPSVIIALVLGNNSLIWTAGLIAALGALDRGRAVAAGLIVALLTVKPQLGILIPVALLAGGQWRAIFWACAGTLAVVAASTALMGTAYWSQFLHSMDLMSGLMQTDIVRFDRMMTWYALSRLAGAGHALAFPLQLAVTLACALAVAWIWRRPGPTDLKAAALCAAIPLATPYAYHYELTLALAAAMFLARDGVGAAPGGRLLLLLLWSGPLLSLIFMGAVPPATYAAPLLTATLGLCLWRASATVRSATA